MQREQQENLLGLLRDGHLRWIEVYLILVRKAPGGERARAGPDGAAARAAPTLALDPRFLRGRARALRGDREQFATAAELLTQARTLAAVLDGLGWSPAPWTTRP